jgi:hypothetical protein
MSEGTIKAKCQWRDGCSDNGVHHVMYDMQPLGVTDQDERSSTIHFRVMHADVCAQHLTELRAQNRGVMDKTDGCTPDCPSGR